METLFGDTDFTSGTCNDGIQEKVDPDPSKDGAKDGKNIGKGDGKGDAKDEDNDEEKLLGNEEVQQKKRVGLAMAKPCIAKAIDYTMLEILLLVQYTRCKRPSVTQLIKEQAKYAKNNPGDPFVPPALFSCDTEGSPSVFFQSSENAAINALIMTTISISIFYGVFCGIVVWYHSSRKAKDVEIHPVTEKLYKCTDRIIVFDTLVEIPISFFWAPLMTVFLWFSFSTSIVGLFFLSKNYNKIMVEDDNAQAVFFSSAVVTGISLFKLTGEISQYWVKYAASISWDTKKELAEKLSTTPLGKTSEKLFRSVFDPGDDSTSDTGNGEKRCVTIA
jgi:hypothetical protein